MKKIAKRFKIQQYVTTAYHPQSNGSIEKSHHATIEYLKMYIDKHSNWDEWVDLAMFSYNTSVHEGTKIPPHELVFGRIAREPSHEPVIEESLEPTYKEYLENLNDKLFQLQALAHENFTQDKAKSKEYNNRKINPQNFKVGDTEYMIKEPRKEKLSEQYTGPYKVLEILPNQNVRIQSNGGTRVVHINKLKIAHFKR